MNERTASSHAHNVPAARALRAKETAAEEVLWQSLRGRRLDGLKFRRQHPIGPFVVDFCCVEIRLAIELDGEVHDHLQEHDAKREELLAATGYRVLRFPNEAVLHEQGRVLMSIRAAARDVPTPRPPAPGRAPGWS